MKTNFLLFEDRLIAILNLVERRLLSVYNKMTQRSHPKFKGFNQIYDAFVWKIKASSFENWFILGVVAGEEVQDHEKNLSNLEEKKKI